MSHWILVVLLSAVVLLASVAVVITKVVGTGERLLPQDSPEGVVQRFLLAVDAGDYREAYNYLGTELKEECTYDNFLTHLSRERVQDIQATLVGAEPFDDRTEVTLSITWFDVTDSFVFPFDNPASSYQKRYMLRYEEGNWLFSQIPWPMHGCPGVDMSE